MKSLFIVLLMLTVGQANATEVDVVGLFPGKAILVVDGDKVTIRGLTFARAHLPEFNGAGIRAEGGDLTIEDTRFVNNENGLMSAPNPNATIRVTGSSFFGNGSCKGACAHGIYAGHIKLLHVERSVFRDTHEGHHIKSRALRTEIVNCNIQDGPAGASSYLIDVPNGGSLLIEKNKLEKGPMTQNQGAAIMIGAEGVNQPTNEIIVRNNSFTNDSRGPTVFVNNRTETVAVLTGNLFTGAVSPLSDATGPVH